jgi:hypothetical protein
MTLSDISVGFYANNDEPSVSIKGGEFLDQLLPPQEGNFSIELVGWLVGWLVG